MFSSLRTQTPRALCRFASTKPAHEPIAGRVQSLVASVEKKYADASSSTAKEGVTYGDDRHMRADLTRLRVVPRDSAFYMANPPHEEITRRLKDLIEAHIKLPVLPKTEVVPANWMSMDDYRSKIAGPRMRPSQYKQFVELANRLHRIDPQLMPPAVEELLNKLKNDSAPHSAVSVAAKRTLDAQGRAIAVGHRKTSSARVIVARAQEGTVGQFLVNGKRLDEYFPQQLHRQKIAYPLAVVEAAGKYNVFASVQGGGANGQADAVANGLGQALRIQNPLLGTRLRKAGCIKRDLRIKERKKPGLAKARKAYTWVKR